MTVSIIIGVSLYPVVLIMYFWMCWLAKADNGYCFGAVLPAQRKDEPEIAGIRKEFRRRMNVWLAVFLVLPVGAFFIPYISVSMTIWMTWLLFAIFSPLALFVGANRKVLRWKQEQGLAGTEPGISYTELKAAGRVRLVRPLPFLAALAAGFLPPLGAAFGFWKTAGSFPGFLEPLLWTIAALGFLFWGAAFWMDRLKTEVISMDSSVNLNYARAKKRIWKNMWLVILWMNTGWNGLLVLLAEAGRDPMAALLITSVLYSILTIAAVVFALVKVFRLNGRYRKERTLQEADSSDACWIGGLIYYNKKDRHVMVEQRAGGGSTLNMATPAGMGITLFSCLMLLCIPVMCVWMLLDEFTPIHLTVAEQTVEARHLKTDYEIPLSGITDVSVIEELPEWTKVNGTAMDGLEKGTFEIWHEGKCKVFLNPQNHLFLKLTTDDGVYYVGGYDDAETRQVYEALTAP